jgi:hypothetical protein
MGENRTSYNVLMEKLKEKRIFGRPKPRWEGNIKRDLKEICWKHGLD